MLSFTFCRTLFISTVVFTLLRLNVLDSTALVIIIGHSALSQPKVVDCKSTSISSLKIMAILILLSYVYS